MIIIILYKLILVHKKKIFHNIKLLSIRVQVFQKFRSIIYFLLLVTENLDFY